MVRCLLVGGGDNISSVSSIDKFGFEVEIELEVEVLKIESEFDMSPNGNAVERHFLQDHASCIV